MNGNRRINRRALLGTTAAGTALAMLGGAVPAGASPSPVLVTVTRGFLLTGNQFVPVNVAGALVTLASSVNDKGRILGTYSLDGSELHHGFVRDKLGTTSFDVPGAQGTFPQDINNEHQIVGVYVTPAITIHGFLLKQGEYLTIDMPGSTWNSVNGINDRGELVGSWVDGAGVQHGFIRRRGQEMTSYDFPSPDAAGSTLIKINNEGVVLGAYHDTSRSFGFLIEDGVISRIEVPGAISVAPSGLNDHGEVVGYYRDSQRAIHGFVLRDGRVTKVDAPGADTTLLFDINNSGQIAGATETTGLGARSVGIYPAGLK